MLVVLAARVLAAASGCFCSCLRSFLRHLLYLRIAFFVRFLPFGFLHFLCLCGLTSPSGSGGGWSSQWSAGSFGSLPVRTR